MGWWQQSEEGVSFAAAETGEVLMWGDGPADIIDAALDMVVADFESSLGRKPTGPELMAGLTFSTRVRIESLPSTVAEAQGDTA